MPGKSDIINAKTAKGGAALGEYPEKIEPDLKILVSNTQVFNPAIRLQLKNIDRPGFLQKRPESGTDYDGADLSDEMLGNPEPDTHSEKDRTEGFKNLAREWQDQLEGPDLHGGRNVEADLEDVKLKRKGTEELPEAAGAEESDKLPLTEEDVKKKGSAESSARSAKESGAEKRKHDVVKNLPILQDNGFIITDPRRKLEADERAEAGEIGDVWIEEKKASEAKPQLIEDRLKKVFKDLIITKKESSPYKKLCDILSVFGIGILEAVRDNGTRILLLPESHKITDYEVLFKNKLEKLAREARWGYFTDEKIMVLGEEVMDSTDPLMKIPVFYFALAFDQALGEQGFASESSPAVMANFKACKNKLPGHQFIDSFSSLSPMHYFASTLETYLSEPEGVLSRGRNKASPSRVCTKEQLYDADRSMYMYIEYLVKRMNSMGK